MESDQQAPSSPPLPSDDDVCSFLYGRQKRSMYPMYVKFHTTMVKDSPPSDIEAMKKAVQNQDKRGALKIMGELLQASRSVDLYRIEAEIGLECLTNSDGSLRTDRRKDLLYKYLEKSITFSKRLASLKENIIENHYYYVTFLSLHAHLPEHRLNVIQQCLKALEIDKVFDKGDPEDPQGPRSKINNLLKYMIDRHERIETIWKSMIDGRGFIELTFNDLDAFYSNHVNDESARQVVTDALRFGTSHDSWTFRQCFICDEKFDSLDPLISHILVEHWVTQYLQSQSQSQSPILKSPIETFKMIPVEEPILKFQNPEVGLSGLLVSRTCLLNPNTDAQTEFPTRDISISIISYRSILNQWINLRNSRKCLGAQFMKFMTPVREGANSADETSVTTVENAQATTVDRNQTLREEIGSWLKRICAEIDTKIKATGFWSHQDETMGEEEQLLLRDDPLGEYHYRDVLLPLLKSCIAGRVENQAEEEYREEMRQAGNQ